jgi:hypothetical protein
LGHGREKNPHPVSNVQNLTCFSILRMHWVYQGTEIGADSPSITMNNIEQWPFYNLSRVTQASTASLTHPG